MKKLFLSILASLVAAVSYAQPLSTIANAKVTPFGTAVRVRGILTNGVEGGNTRFVMDNTGGIGVFAGAAGSPTRVTLDAMSVGDSVEVVGTTGHFRCLIQVASTTSVTNLGTRAASIPVVEYNSSNWADAYTAGNIGKVVRLTGINQMSTVGATPTPVTSFATSGSGTNFAMQGNQSLVFRVLTASNLPNSAVPSGTFSVQGVMGRFQNITTPDTGGCTDNTGYQLIGRTTADVFVPATGPARLSGSWVNPSNDTTANGSANFVVRVSAMDSSNQQVQSVVIRINDEVAATIRTATAGVFTATVRAPRVNGVYTMTAIVNGVGAASINLPSRRLTVENGNPDYALPIAQAKLLNVGDSVIVRGIVTAPADMGRSRFIADANAGMGIFVPTGSNFWAGVNVGDSVEVGGRIAYFNCLVQVSSPEGAFRMLQTARPVQVTTFDSATITGAYDDMYLGRVIRFEGVREFNSFAQGAVTGRINAFPSTSTTSCLNQNVDLTVRTLAGSALAGFGIPAGTRYAVTGVMGRFQSQANPANCTPGVGYQLMPRFTTDIEVLLSTKSLEALGLSVFPNPTVGYLTVNTNQGALRQISLINGLGQVVRTQQVSGVQSHVSTDGLASGVYMVRIETTQGSSIARIIKK